MSKKKIDIPLRKVDGGKKSRPVQLDGAMNARMQKFRQVNWSEIARRAWQEALEQLESGE